MQEAKKEEVLEEVLEDLEKESQVLCSGKGAA